MNSVQYIDLSAQNSFLNGKLTGKLGTLCNLRVLDLSLNNINGELIEFTDGLSNCTNYSNLEYLHLGYNKLGGFLPDSLCHLRNLKDLLLMGNSFSGSIPESVGNLSSLEELWLSENGMKGTIPASLGQLSSLVVLNTENNQWECVVTKAHFSNLASLKELSIVQKFNNMTLSFQCQF
ncbi:hypothetical protein Patl1_37237 [Pistacia atlantica]|nr:hypothetical protein Patl1_37237 [Pistacia atlantica]